MTDSPTALDVLVRAQAAMRALQVLVRDLQNILPKAPPSKRKLPPALKALYSIFYESLGNPIGAPDLAQKLCEQGFHPKPRSIGQYVLRLKHELKDRGTDEEIKGVHGQGWCLIPKHHGDKCASCNLEPKRNSDRRTGDSEQRRREIQDR